jgi:hypothetical protein
MCDPRRVRGILGALASQHLRGHKLAASCVDDDLRQFLRAACFSVDEFRHCLHACKTKKKKN